MTTVAPIVVIDLPSHTAACARCRLYSLCHVGRRLAEAQATAMLEMASMSAANRWRRDQPA